MSYKHFNDSLFEGIKKKAAFSLTDNEKNLVKDNIKIFEDSFYEKLNKYKEMSGEDLKYMNYPSLNFIKNYRKDLIQNSSPEIIEKIMGQVPKRKGNYIVVPSVR